MVIYGEGNRMAWEGMEVDSVLQAENAGLDVIKKSEETKPYERSGGEKKSERSILVQWRRKRET